MLVCSGICLNVLSISCTVTWSDFHEVIGCAAERVSLSGTRKQRSWIVRLVVELVQLANIVSRCPCHANNESLELLFSTYFSYVRATAPNNNFGLFQLFFT